MNGSEIEEVARLAEEEAGHQSLARDAKTRKRQIVEALAKRPGGAEAAVRALYATWRHGYNIVDARATASTLASWQPAELLTALLRDPPRQGKPDIGERALFEALVQEMVLREMPVHVEGLWFEKLASERFIELPRFKTETRPKGKPVILPDRWSEVPLTAGEKELELLTDEWPNGSTIARRFLPAETAIDSDVGDVEAESIDFAVAFAELFGMLYGGGCYGEPLFGAAARAAAWSTTATLVRGSLSDFRALEAQASACRWLRLRHPSDLIDLRLAVQRTDGSMIILHLTDSD